MGRRVLGLALFFLLVGAAPALAGGGYTPPSIDADVKDNVVTVEGTGCAPGATVTVQTPGGTQTTVANPDGSFSLQFAAPTSGSSLQIVATCDDLVQTVVVPLGTTPPPTAAPPAKPAPRTSGLPVTGSDSAAASTIGFALVGLGALAIYASRRRSHTA